MSNKTPYSFLIGLKKTLINALIFLGPVALSLLTHADEWLPNAEKYAALFSLLIYLLKNYIKNK